MMWGRKKFGIDMVMVNESREREREREVERGGGSRRYAVGFSMWHAGGLTYSIYEPLAKVYKSIQNGEPSALDHTSTVVLDTSLPSLKSTSLGHSQYTADYMT